MSYLPVYYKIILSNGEVAVEQKNITSWKSLLLHCRNNNLTIKNFDIYYKDKSKKIIRNHSKICFIVQDVKSFSNKKTLMKKGYGTICHHPGNIKRCYIDWFNLKDGRLLYPEIIKNNKIPDFYQVIGIKVDE